MVRENLETWLAQRRAGRLVAGSNWVIDPVSGYVERDLRKFLGAAFWRTALRGRGVSSAARTFW